MISATYNNKSHPADFSLPQKPFPGQFLFVMSDSRNFTKAGEGYQQQPAVRNLNEAKSYLQQTRISALPELIIIDTPLDVKELTFFKNWLSQNVIPPIPTIYIERFLNPTEIKELLTSALIDDVINKDWDTKLLHQKISFFKSLAVQSLIDPRFGEKTKRIRKPLHRKFFKRGLDLFLSISLLLLLSPIFILIGILIKLTSKGPILYKSKRAGEGFTVFSFYKFRTMVSGADELLNSLNNKNMYTASQAGPSFFKVANDPRVTRIGLFLRNTSLDELPQLFNVLKGDMSLVGNRPLPLYEAATLTTREWAERFMAPAGITGLWQISKRGKPKMSAEERISMDIAYARNRSIRKDLRILLATPAALIQKQSQ